MKRLSILTILSALFAVISAWATIIIIPTDYPTIQQGIDVSTDNDIVIVLPGTYAENINFNGHNIVLGSLFYPSHDTFFVSQTIIDGDTSGPVVTFNQGENCSARIAGFTIRNGYAVNGGGIICSSSHPTIDHNAIIGNNADSNGGGIYCDNSNSQIRSNLIVDNSACSGEGGGIYCRNNPGLVVYGNIIRGNSANDGGGIYCLSSNPLIRNNIISNNTATGGPTGNGGGIYLSEAGPDIINNTLGLNSAGNGGGIAILNASYPVIINTIFSANVAPIFAQILVDDISWSTVTYSNIQDTLWPGAGNLSVDPLFRDTANGDYHLMSISCGDTLDSPCIDAGYPAFIDSLLDCSWGLGTYMSDMGAYGGGDSVIVGIINYPPIPGEFILMQNYPNPFNSGTTIRFSIVKSTEVRLAVYDMLGRKVRTLIDEYKQAGIHTANFDATGLSSGVYFCRLQVGEVVKTRPMVFLK
ncbi:MAG: right-handed parallel beta-helix repeat-containing protein [Candidatus Zixiibacteriota bacterium]|nr:MAG: right-handed parallel beta-helix repeat-containing protein [candidate division Zixibacteria bacterium]